MATVTASANQNVTEYEPHVVQRLVQEGKARLIDIREADERRRERIDGSASIPVGSVTTSAVTDPAGRMPILHCRSGRRSLAAAQELARGGCPNAAHLKGGLDAWKAAGLPVVVDRKAPMTTMQQTQALMGSIVLVSTALGAFVTPWALVLTAFVGSGMVFAGLTGSCAMNDLLAKAPWNKSRGVGGGCSL